MKFISCTAAVAALLVIGPPGSGCGLLEDDQPPVGPATTTMGGMTDGDELTCIEAAVHVQSICEYPLQFWVDYSGGTSSMTLVDDPVASVGVGPGAWLVHVASAADYVGVYHHGGDDCEMGCGWCGRGEHLCHGGLTDAGQPTCWACLPFDDPNAAEACIVALTGCSEEGLDETGADPTSGEDDDPDATGSEGVTDDEVPPYDCAMWEPREGVSEVGTGVLSVDVALVEAIVMFEGEPLSSCDDTRFRLRADGFFEISRRSDEGLLAALGLEPGDVILAVDGETMKGLEAVMLAVEERFSYGRIPSGLTLLVGRGSDQFVTTVLIQ
ncbi:PDZ domain-containing protein [Paraliomyxa miuraensis]|uniref:hypothetical protein n=1 Tax=Paraliomyxa miuraensis TaxID=376150 RepID=UPI00225457EE|nr:hypothetical protein [Paraliomyxa miuraensis]MCX4241327.1 hypothetical protein [Paraliomyxa miuraensis]